MISKVPTQRPPNTDFACSGHPSPRCPCPTWLRGLRSCTKWAGLKLRSSHKRIASYILCGGLSVSTHRLQFPSHSHFRLSMSWAVRDDLPDAVLGRDNWWLTGSPLRHYSVLVLAHIHLHRRTQFPNEWLHECCFHFPSACEVSTACLFSGCRSPVTPHFPLGMGRC